MRQGFVEDILHPLIGDMPPVNSCGEDDSFLLFNYMLSVLPIFLIFLLRFRGIGFSYLITWGAFSQRLLQVAPRKENGQKAKTKTTKGVYKDLAKRVRGLHYDEMITE